MPRTSQDLKSGNDPVGDPRVRRTHRALRGALLELVETKDLASIGVAELVERADLSRSTFYDHYRDVHDLAEAACTSLVDALVESLPTPSSEVIEAEGPRSLEAFFTNIAEHAGLYSSILGPQGSARVSEHVRTRVTTAIRAGIDVEPSAGDGGRTGRRLDVTASFISGALLGVARDWLQRGHEESPAELARQVLGLLRAVP